MLDLRPFKLPDDGTPIGRIAGTILRYAIKDGASEIHLQMEAEGRGFEVLYLLKSSGELREQMKIPAYVWQPLRVHLEGLLGPQNQLRIDFQSDLPALFLSFDLTMSVRDSPYGQDLVLFLSGAH